MLFKTMRNWALFIIGIGVVAFAVVMLFTPGFDWALTTMLFGATFLLIATLDLLSWAVQRKELKLHGLALANSLTEYGVGAAFMLAPLMGQDPAALFGGVVLLAYGIFQLFAAGYGFGGVYEGAGEIGFSGLTAAFTGVVLMAAPGVAGLFICLYLGCRGLAMVAEGAVAQATLPTKAHPYGI